MTVQSLVSPAYSRSGPGMVTRPCLSGISSEAPERKTRMKSRAPRLVVGAWRIASVIRSNSSMGKT